MALDGKGTPWTPKDSVGEKEEEGEQDWEEECAGDHELFGEDEAADEDSASIMQYRSMHDTCWCMRACMHGESPI